MNGSLLNRAIACLPLLMLGGVCMSQPGPTTHCTDLRPRWAELGLTPKSQHPRGTCSVFATTGLLEFELASAHGPGPRLSEEFVNWASHTASGRDSDGSFFSDAIDGLQLYGACVEQLLPYAAEFDAKLQPSAEASSDAATRRDVTSYWIKLWDVHTGMTETMLARIRQSLDQGHPVALGMRWPNEESYDEHHVLALPPADKVFDGHSVVLVAYREDAKLPGGGAFCFRNSSGPKWQDAGHAWLSYGYVAAYGNDAVGLRLAGPSTAVADETALPIAALPVSSSHGEAGAAKYEVRWRVDVPAADLYELAIWATRGGDAGIARVGANKLTLQAGLDLYAADGQAAQRIVLGVMPLAAGANTVTVECRGKNSASGGYRLPIDKLVLRRMP